MDAVNNRLVIRLAPGDNIVVARCDIPAGTEIPQEGIVALQDIPLGHKVAAVPITKGTPILKYNTVIGYASRDVSAGAHMHNDNIAADSTKAMGSYQFCQDYRPLEPVPPDRQRMFQGYLREDGRAGTRNCILVLTCSNCAATVARKIADHFSEEVLAAYPHVDAVVPLITASGCGMEKSGTPLEYLQRLIAGHIQNPNVACALVCSLGCETNNIDALLDGAGLTPGPMLGRLVIQEEGGSRKAVERGIELVGRMLPLADACRRQPLPVRYLKVALECGGSDGLSGISANPALGRAMDLLAAQGGTAVLTELTELIGMEGALARRARTPEIAQQLIDKMRWWLDYCAGRDAQINGKVTPGNNAGGITNVLEKALGSAQKSGSTGLNGVFDYAQRIDQPGFVMMDSPSYDPVAGAAMFAGGCNLCAFTTGRGSCYGSRHMPTLKIASNTPLYLRQEDDMDINAGAVVDGEKTLEQMGEEIFEALIALASGQPSKSEAFGMGSDEFVVWWRGVTA